MGLLKKIFAAVFGLISSLLRLVGIGKKSDYFLELDASQTPAPAEASADFPVAETQTEPAIEAPVTEAAAAVATTTTAETKAPAAPAPSAPKAEPAPAPAMTFAPDYLLPTASSKRRRPGANMGAFMDLAKQVKTPVSS